MQEAEDKPEFFKLDEIDRKTLFWLMDNSPQSIQSWTEYVAAEYRARKSMAIDFRKLYHEITGKLNENENMPRSGSIGINVSNH